MKERCDFCSFDQNPVVTVYPCADFFDPVRIMKSVGGWGACGTCAALIDAGNREGLLNRSIASFEAINGPLPREHKPLLRQYCGDTHTQFFRNRIIA